MIRLTLKNSNEAWYVNPDHIVSIGKHVNQEGNTYVETTVYDGDCIVTESPEEVARKVLEWRLAMEDFKACLMIHDASTSGVVNKLHNLAGLEGEGCQRQHWEYNARFATRT